MSDAIATTLIDWFRQHGRDLPWRHTRDPYRILVSELMLQQTQVERVIPKYHAFLALFPDIQTLANAPTSAVITAWQGLGYNRRAIYLQRTAQAVVAQYNGQFPRDIDTLRALPGIGDYTSGAIACFAFEQDVAFLDTNIRRVVLRLWSDPHGDMPYEKALRSLASQQVPAGQGWWWNQAPSWSLGQSPAPPASPSARSARSVDSATITRHGSLPTRHSNHCLNALLGASPSAKMRRSSAQIAISADGLLIIYAKRQLVSTSRRLQHIL